MAFKAKRDGAPKFVDLGEKVSELKAEASRRPYYPSLHLRKTVKGLDKVGKTKTVRIKVKVRGIEMREGEDPSVSLDVKAIEGG